MPTNGRRAEEAPSACSRPGCRNDAASPRAKLCTACFKTIASLTNAQRKALRGGGGVPGNRGNSGGKGAPGNRGNSSKGRSAAEYIRDVRDYVAEHGRPPRRSSRLHGTAEYRLGKMSITR